MKAIVVGCGRVGSAVAKKLTKVGWDVTAIDENEEALARLGEHWSGGFVVGHGMDVNVLRKTGHVVTITEPRRDRFAYREEELELLAIVAEATEIFVLERAGIARPPDL